MSVIAHVLEPFSWSDESMPDPKDREPEGRPQSDPTAAGPEADKGTRRIVEDTPIQISVRRAFWIVGGLIAAIGIAAFWLRGEIGKDLRSLQRNHDTRVSALRTELIDRLDSLDNRTKEIVRRLNCIQGELDLLWEIHDREFTGAERLRTNSYDKKREEIRQCRQNVFAGYRVDPGSADLAFIGMGSKEDLLLVLGRGARYVEVGRRTSVQDLVELKGILSKELRLSDDKVASVQVRVGERLGQMEEGEGIIVGF
jgi:hypothetical protein